MAVVEETYPELSIMRFVDDACRVEANRAFFVTDLNRHVYRELRSWIRNLAAFFQAELGLGPKSIIAFSTLNSIYIPVVLGAAQLVGSTVALLSTAVGQEELAARIDIVNPDLVVFSNVDQFEELRSMTSKATFMSVEKATPGVMSVDEQMRKSSGDDELRLENASADARIIVFSSGSTGDPKAIVNRASAFAFNGVEKGRSLGLEADDIVFLPVPLIHVFGLASMYAVLSAHATLVTTAKYHADVACRLIQDEHATVHLGVPTNFVRELRESADGTWDLNSLRVGLVGGAECPSWVLREFQDRFGCEVVQSYGMSETSATLTLTPLGHSVDERAATVGYPILGAELKIDPSSSEILCKTPSMMEGVLQPDGTVELDLDDGWLRTGDVGRLSPDGALSVTGRLKYMIVRGAINIFPSEVETAYAEHEDVMECCAFGVKDDELGQRICLAVVAREGAQLTSAGLRAYARDRIDKCKIPDMVMMVRSLPCLGNGKVDRGALEELARTMVSK